MEENFELPMLTILPPELIEEENELNKLLLTILPPEL